MAAAAIIPFESIRTLEKSCDLAKSILKNNVKVAMKETIEGLDVIFDDNMHTESQIKELHACMEVYAECDIQISSRLKVMQEIKKSLEDGQAPPMEDYSEFLKTRVDANTQKTPIKQHPQLIEFATNLTSLKRSLEDKNEIEMVSRDISTVCPITKSQYTLTGPMEPVRSKCGHTYSRAAIQQMLKSNQRNGRHTKCPLQGCSQFVQAETLVVDKELIRHMKRNVDDDDNETEESQLIED